jgi:hypothetical protein
VTDPTGLTATSTRTVIIEVAAPAAYRRGILHTRDWGHRRVIPSWNYLILEIDDSYADLGATSTRTVIIEPASPVPDYNHAALPCRSTPPRRRATRS